MTKAKYRRMREFQTRFLLNLMEREEREARAEREARRPQPKPDQTKAA